MADTEENVKLHMMTAKNELQKARRIIAAALAEVEQAMKKMTVKPQGS